MVPHRQLYAHQGPLTADQQKIYAEIQSRARLESVVNNGLFWALGTAGAATTAASGAVILYNEITGEAIFKASPMDSYVHIDLRDEE